MENNEINEVFQADKATIPGPVVGLRYVQIESIIRKIRADGWAKNADERAITEEALRAIRTAFPELSATEAAAAVRRLKRA